MTIVIDDNNWQSHVSTVDPSLNGRGYQQRDRQSWPIGSSGHAKAFDLPLIPRSEWDDRIKQLEDNRATLRHVLLDAKIPSLDQNGTNYCWANGVVTGMTAIRAVNRQPYVELSPASVAAPIKGYRNYGGWGGEALEYIIQHGISSTEFWPANAINSKYDNADSQNNRKRHVVTEWYDLDCDDRDIFDAVFTCLLLGMPVAIGLDWWSHEVCALYPVKSGREYHLGCRNSWGNGYGEQGFFELAGSRAIPSDACVPLVITGAAP